MVLGKLIKKSFNNIISNPVVCLFLVVFIIILSYLTKYIAFSKTIAMALILIAATFASICAFISGWLKLIKEISKENKVKDENYFVLFMEGIGENIIPVTMGIIIYLILFGITIFLIRTFALSMFGSLDFLLNDVKNIQTNTQLIEYFNNLPIDKQYIITTWQFSFIIGISVFQFLFLFYFPSIMSDNKSNIFIRSFIAFWKCLKFTFKNFFSIVLLCIFIHVAYILFAFLNAIFAKYMILSIILLFIYIYFIYFVIMLIFNYYEEKTNCFNGPYSIGQDEIDNSISKEN